MEFACDRRQRRIRNGSIENRHERADCNGEYREPAFGRRQSVSFYDGGG